MYLLRCFLCIKLLILLSLNSSFALSAPGPTPALHPQEYTVYIPAGPEYCILYCYQKSRGKSLLAFNILPITSLPFEARDAFLRDNFVRLTKASSGDSNPITRASINAHSRSLGDNILPTEAPRNIPHYQTETFHKKNTQVKGGVKNHSFINNGVEYNFTYRFGSFSYYANSLPRRVYHLLRQHPINRQSQVFPGILNPSSNFIRNSEHLPSGEVAGIVNINFLQDFLPGTTFVPAANLMPAEVLVLPDQNAWYELAEQLGAFQEEAEEE